MLKNIKKKHYKINSFIGYFGWWILPWYGIGLEWSKIEKSTYHCYHGLLLQAHKGQDWWINWDSNSTVPHSVTQCDSIPNAGLWTHFAEEWQPG